MGDDAMIAIMTRMDIMRDDITDLKLDVARANDAHEDHAERLGNLEDMTKTVVEGIEEIKNGPVYSLDRVITKRVLYLLSVFSKCVSCGNEPKDKFSKKENECCPRTPSGGGNAVVSKANIEWSRLGDCIPNRTKVSKCYGRHKRKLSLRR